MPTTTTVSCQRDKGDCRHNLFTCFSGTEEWQKCAGDGAQQKKAEQKIIIDQATFNVGFFGVPCASEEQRRRRRQRRGNAGIQLQVSLHTNIRSVR